MRKRSCFPWYRTAVMLALLAPAAAGAQSVQLRVGGFLPTAGGDFWSDTEDTFTADRTDFFDGSAGFTFLVPAGNYIDIGLDASYYGSSVESAQRGFADEFGFPVVHDSKLTLVPLMLDFRVSPAGRYEMSGGHHEYLKKQPGIYFGGGIGSVFWQYEEIGDFVSRSDDTIFFDRFKDNGASLAAHAMVGADIPLAEEWSLIAEGRYLWANDDLEDDFAGLGNLDLSGATFSVGVAFHF